MNYTHIMELNHNQKQTLLKRFPPFELSYEIVSHKKVCEEPGICIAIPPGKKYYIWFTYNKTSNHVCYLMELNKDKKIAKVSLLKIDFDPSLAIGTILYGTIPEDSLSSPIPNTFIVDDIYMYHGLLLRNLSFGEKFGFFRHLAQHNLFEINTKSPMNFHLPYMWISPTISEIDSVVPSHLQKTIGYTCHHVQYREIMKISPYLNFFPTKLKDNSPQNTQQISQTQIQTLLQTIKSEYVHDYFKPQYKQKALFKVTADIQFDIYHLHAYKNPDFVYYGIAYIPNYKSSVFMNRLFRNIRENIDLDYIEESEDEEEFENIAHDKYVDLTKSLYMECVFHPKFKKWEPIKQIECDDPSNVVSIWNLVVSKYQNKHKHMYR